MSALPIEPTLAQLDEAIADRGPHMQTEVTAFQLGIEAERARAAAESEGQWGMQSRPGKVLITQNEGTARHLAGKYGTPLVRRAIGPWEVQS